MEERNKQTLKMTPKLRIRTLKHQPQSVQEHKALRETSSSEDVSQKAESSATRKKRSQTFSAHVKSPTLRSETMLISLKSTFFDSVDITTPYTESVEFAPLQLQSKTMDEMLTMLKQVLNCLFSECQCQLSMSYQWPFSRKAHFHGHMYIRVHM